MNKRFRLLKKGEFIDRNKGDQFQDTGNGLWILTHETGELQIIHPGRYRRPKVLKESDLHENTAESS